MKIRDKIVTFCLPCGVVPLNERTVIRANKIRRITPTPAFLTNELIANAPPYLYP